MILLSKIAAVVYGVQLFFVGLLFLMNTFKGEKLLFFKNLIPFYWVKLVMIEIIEGVGDRWNQLDNPKDTDHDY